MEKLRYFVFLLLAVLLTSGITFLVRDWYQREHYALISFDHEIHSFDTLYRQEDASFYFVYKNSGNKDLKIHSIQPGCGCTVPEWNSNFLEPDAVGIFKISYNIENKGNFIKEIMVYSNSQTSPDHLVISGYVPIE